MHQSRTEIVELHADGLSDCCHPKIHRLGHRGSRLVYQAYQDEVQHTVDSSSGLALFPIEEVFLDRTSVLLGCGTPNAALSLYRDDGPKGAGWYKFAAFMFWRQGAYIAPTRGRLQSGLYLELRHLLPEAREALWQAMSRHSGERGPSCARLNAEVLADAGFTLGNGASLRRTIRPSKYASLLWQYGIAYHGTLVDVRIVLTGDKGVGDHLKGAWLKEMSAPQRMIKKIFMRGHEGAMVPTFPEREMLALDASRWHGRVTTIGVNRPSRLGVNLTFLFGQQPIYVVTLDGLEQVAALREPLEPFPGTLDRVTKLKKHVLFSPLIIRLIRRSRHASMDYFHGVRAGAAVDMLTPSDGPDHDTAAIYNCVVMRNDDGSAEARITSLKNQDMASKQSRIIKMVNWVLAKHVLISGYDPQTIYACEVWCYKRHDGRVVLCLNNNSGTYRPDVDRLRAIAAYLETYLDVPVEVSLMDEATG